MEQMTGSVAARSANNPPPRERPILFSGPMVRALLAGTKTQTRRPVKRYGDPEFWEPRRPGVWEYFDTHTNQTEEAWAHLYGVPGDRLWVRETWQAIHVYVDPETGWGDDVDHAREIPKDDRRGWWRAVHAATDPMAAYHKDDRGFPWRPAIHMPRWASRLTLEVTGVRVERLDAITEEDAKAEGVKPFPLDPEGDCWTDGKHRTAFQYLWGEINGWQGPKSWDANPWVWVVEFRRLDAETGLEATNGDAAPPTRNEAATPLSEKPTPPPSQETLP